jgi:hypothetical protein
VVRSVSRRTTRLARQLFGIVQVLLQCDTASEVNRHPPDVGVLAESQIGPYDVAPRRHSGEPEMSINTRTHLLDDHREERLRQRFREPAVLIPEPRLGVWAKTSSSLLLRGIGLSAVSLHSSHTFSTEAVKHGCY